MCFTWLQHNFIHNLDPLEGKVLHGLNPHVAKITHPLLNWHALHTGFEESCFVWHQSYQHTAFLHSWTINQLSSSSPISSPNNLLIQQPPGWPPTSSPALSTAFAKAAPGGARWLSCTYAELLLSAAHPEPSLASLPAQEGPSRASCCSCLAHAPTFSPEQSTWRQGVGKGQPECTNPTPDTSSAPLLLLLGWGCGLDLQQRPPRQWEQGLELLPLILPTTSSEIASFVQDSNPWLLLSAYQHTLLLFLEQKIVWHIVLERLPTPHLH